MALLGHPVHLPLARGLVQAAYQSYLKSIWWMHRTFGIRTFGLGWVASQIGFEFAFRFRSVPFRFVPTAAGLYRILPAGLPNEPELHTFLNRVLQDRGQVLFVDVGAGIGEFAIPMAHDPRVSSVLAFEAHPDTCLALQQSARLAPAGRIAVIGKGVSKACGYSSLEFQGPGGRVSHDRVEVCTLDTAVQANPQQAVIVLIDMKGGELDVLRGARHLVRNNMPLIIFEYSEATRRAYPLEAVALTLGPGYTLMRLRSEDGLLDDEFNDTWNLVALPHRGVWADLLRNPNLFARPQRLAA